MEAKKVFLLICVISLMLAVAGCGSKTAAPSTPAPTTTTPTAPAAPAKLPYEGKKLLYIDAYHEGYAWSDGITQGVKDKVAGTGIDLKIIRMDTKRNPSVEFAQAAALKVKTEIDTWKPDVVIFSDDNPFKYVLMPYYKNSNIPFVYSGVNWNSKTPYGTPYTNAVGMLEIALTPQVMERLKTYAKGPRIGYISGDTETERKTMTYYQSLFNMKFDKEYWVKDTAEFKTSFVKLNSEVDYILLENIAGIKGWENTSNEEMKNFVIDNTKVPTGSTYDFVSPMVLLSIAKVPNEHGEYMVETAKKIMDGAKPSDFQEVESKKGVFFINMKIANNIGVTFTPDLLKSAKQI
jgi:ABC-type uncharacterized transport system substrate-binding protein